MEKRITNKYLISALLIGVLFHGSSIFFTLETTYDALIHLFFADHYASSWFEPWNYSWYTGFTVMGYPPLVHQSIGLLSLIGGLKFGLFTVGIIAIILFITGVYRFSLLMTGKRNIAGYAALVAVFSSSFVETLHIFGQLPSIIGISVLMHALPEIYLWIKTGKYKYLIRAFSLLAVTVTSHHVTPIFGMIFFIFPLIGMVIMDSAKDQVGSYSAIRFKTFLNTFFKLFWRIVGFGMGSLTLIIFCILPYWINTKNNPITQVPIPHGSRDNFLEITSSGLVFFLIPWGVLLFIFPYLFYRYYSKRYLFFGLSLTLLSILGTGGTTPIPKVLLGDNAFNILTLDRFTLWASIMSLPMFGEFCYRFIEGDIKSALQRKFGSVYHRILGGSLAGAYIFVCIFTMSLGYFRPSQPQKIKMLPILNFLKQDQHDHWRYLPLGFGDQMAWLSAQTNAMTVDGNYHSARRLPELTSRAVERLENSKFRGVEGIGSLQQFLTVPEKYNLKYVFSNDKFYDPILYFCGWQRLRQLENGIMVWEKLNIPPIPNIIPKDDVALPLKLMWGLIPVITVLLAFIINIQVIWIQALKTRDQKHPDFFKYGIKYKDFKNYMIRLQHIWAILLLLVISYGSYIFYIKNATQISPQNVVKAYYDALDFKEFKRAYSYIDPESNKEEDQYMLEIAVTDGLLSSYAKMDEINVEILDQTDNTAKARATTYWITPLERIDKVFYLELVKHQGKWFVKPPNYDLDIPPDQLFSQNKTQFYNHGRRRISSEQTFHEDVLKQPVLEVLYANLVKNDTIYTVVGEIQNIDNVPADVVIKATLYDSENQELAVYNAKDQMKHKLVPKEITSFRINFEGIAWMNKGEQKPKTFNPDEFTAISLTDSPITFNLQCAGNVATTDLYKGLALSEVIVNKNKVHGLLFNSGLQEITIPQLIISYYNNQKELVWVDHSYVREGIRPQRKRPFTYELKEISNLKSISQDMENIFINGLPNKDISNKVTPNRRRDQKDYSFIPVDATGYNFIKIEVNNYIGAPN
ncbi:membrane protein [Aquimarina latercula]|uniref:membrane protein n=1 Tax=Aquimarina latercula TaxID=987 RepID=UPI000422914F|nr:membrane protein [Aquimarina latercula]